MSSLKKAFDKLDRESGVVSMPGNQPSPRNDTPAVTASAGGKEAFCLRLAADNARAWELPWASFYGATFMAASRDDALDCIELSFARFEAVLRGKHLAKLMHGLHAMSLPEVRAVDKKFLGLPGADEAPVVVSLEVKKLGH